MDSNRLAIAKAKVHRVKGQIQELDREIRNFFEANDYDITSELNLDRTERIWRFRLRNKNTAHLSVLAGEIGHNLRSALDNLMCEISDLHTGRRDRTYFPFGKTLDIFNGQISQKTKDLPASAITMICALRPYKGGNDLLWAIHDLNREDKHPGIDPISHVQGLQIQQVSVTNGNVLIMGDRHFKHLHARIYTPKIFVVEKMHEDGEFLTTTPFAQVNFAGEPTFQVAFRSVDGFEREPVVEVLEMMRELVENIFAKFEKKFF